MGAVMARWGTGEATVTRLASARRHVESARLTAAGNPEAVYSLGYDAARKAATALLANQGLRPTSVGGHLAVVEAMRAQFPGVPMPAEVKELFREWAAGRVDFVEIVDE
jgi:hypothetical protein